MTEGSAEAGSRGKGQPDRGRTSPSMEMTGSGPPPRMGR